MKLEFSRQIFEKCSNIKVDKNPPSERRVVPLRRTDGRTDRQTDRQTDRHNEASSRLSQVRERA
jgi:hypothetical protein